MEALARQDVVTKPTMGTVRPMALEAFGKGRSRARERVGISSLSNGRAKSDVNRPLAVSRQARTKSSSLLAERSERKSNVCSDVDQ